MGNTNTESFIQTLKQKNINASDYIYSCLNTKYTNIQDRFYKVDLLKKWLDDFRPLDKHVAHELKKRFDVRFTYNSNAIEGNTLTQSETEIVLEKGITIGGKTIEEHLEVIGHKHAIDYIEDLATGNTFISERKIKDIHSLVMREIDKEAAGKYRNIDVKVSGTDHNYPPHYKLQDLMDDFVKWLQNERDILHPVEYAAIAHYKLASIHPFRDGNGRVARLLMNLLLLQNGYAPAIIKNEDRKRYIDSLIYMDKNNDYTPLLDLIVEVEVEALVEYLATVSTAQNDLDKGVEFYREMQKDNL